MPSGHNAANVARCVIVALAANVARWTTLLGLGQTTRKPRRHCAAGYSSCPAESPATDAAPPPARRSLALARGLARLPHTSPRTAPDSPDRPDRPTAPRRWWIYSLALRAGAGATPG